MFETHSMGRRWTNIKFRLGGRKTPVTEASANPRTQEDALFDYIRDRWQSDNIGPVENVDVMFGNFSENKIERVVSDFFREFEFVSKCGVVFVTDSANIGYGWVFERDGDSATCVEKYTGYEGAFGEDVTGMISEDYNIRIDPTWYWD